MDNFKFLPPFIITIMFDIVNFVSVGMGIKITNSGIIIFNYIYFYIININFLIYKWKTITKKLVI